MSYALLDQVRIGYRPGVIRARTIEDKPRYDVLMAGGEWEKNVPEDQIEPLVSED